MSRRFRMLARLVRGIRSWLGNGFRAAPTERHEPPSPAPACPNEPAWAPAAPAEPEQARWHELAAALTDGRLAWAELEMYAWLREADCPPVVRGVLSALWAQRGEEQAAMQLWTRLPRRTWEDWTARETSLAPWLMSLATLADMSHMVRQVQQTLAAHTDAAAERWMQVYDATPEAPEAPETPEIPADITPKVEPQAAVPAPPDQVEALVAELRGQGDLWPTLVAGQRLSPDPSSITLLRQAGARLIDAGAAPADARAQLVLCQALAELALLAHDPADARNWAHRGLQLDPYCAALALIVAQVQDDAHAGPPATQVLAQALTAHPAYADVHAALIRRERADGHPQTAERHLHLWLKREPDHPTARQLEKELAA